MEKEEHKTRRNSTNTVKPRKHSLGLQTERCLSEYNTLPAQSASRRAQAQVEKRRRRSHGLTIKIESPTTGEDSSAGIIQTSGLQTSPNNIYLSGTGQCQSWQVLMSWEGGDVRRPQ